MTRHTPSPTANAHDVTALASVYTNARFRWLGRDCCVAVEQALKSVRQDKPVAFEQGKICREIDDCAGIRETITDDQFESLFVALHRIKCNPSLDEIALVMPEVVEILCPDRQPSFVSQVAA